MEAAADPICLPVVDLKKAQDPAQRLVVAKQLLEALEKVGFLFIDNIEDFDSEKLHSNVKWFFNLSKQEKLQVSRKIWNSASQNHYRGYFPTQDGETSFKEGFEIGQDHPPMTKEGRTIHPFFTEENLWPQGMEGAEQFRQDMRQYYETVLRAGTEILRLVSLGCGLEESWFESMFFPDSVSTLRLLHYPTRPPAAIPGAAKAGDTVLCCSEHSDSGFVTLLATFHYGGLQVQGEDGKWMNVPCRPDSLVMNIGDILSSMSGGKFKSTQHRVVDTNVDRFSVPFFFEPRYDADITRVIPNLGAQVSYSSAGKKGSELYGPFLIDKMRGFAEYREILNTLALQS